MISRIVVAFLLVCQVLAQKPTIKEILDDHEELKHFRKAAVASDLMLSLFDDKSQTLTVFVPKDEFLEKNDRFVQYLGDTKNWHINLRRTVNNHILMDVKLSEEDVFAATKENPLQSLEDILLTNSLFQTIESGKILETFEASNGIVHVVDAVMVPRFFQNSLRELELMPELGPDRDAEQRVAMTDVVDFLGVRDMFDIERPQGTTHIGCRIRAFNRMSDYLKQTTNLSPNVKYGELLNSTFKNESIYNFIEYSLVDRLYYEEDLPDGYEELIMSNNGCGHMWVTKHGDKICFNNACNVIAPPAWSAIGTTPEKRKRVASNGIVYVTDKCVICPGIANLVEHASEFTKHNLKDVAQFFISSEWNLRNLSWSVGDGSPVTMFAAIDSGWGEVTGVDTTRLSTDMWKEHQWDFLRHMLIQGNWSAQELRELAEQNGGAYNLTSLANQTLLLEIDETRDKLMLEGGDLFLEDIKGVDGLVHLVSVVPLVRSVTHSVYDIGDWLGNHYEQLNLIDNVFLRADMKRLEPLTAVYAPDYDWRNKIVELDRIEPILENHLFEGLMWCHELVDMATRKESIESLNGQVWGLSINGFGMPCFDTIVGFGEEVVSSCVTSCDHLARNGIVLTVDKVILAESLETRGPSPPLPDGARPPRNPGGGVNRPSFEGSSSGYVPGGVNVSFKRPKRLYDWDEEDPDFKDSSAKRQAALLAAILPVQMLI